MSLAEPDASNGPQLDPLIDALLDHLPAPGDPFPAEDRKLWLQILELAFKLIHPEETADEPAEPTQQQHGGQA